MKEYFKIIPNPILRDARTERRIIEENRERLIYMMLTIGAVLMLVGFLW